MNWSWFLIGLTSLIVSNLFSAYRWSQIAGLLGIETSLSIAVRLYAQGITANTVLPGGILGGDVLRTIGLASRGAIKSVAALSVFFDRLSGVWVLGLCSLIACILVIAFGQIVFTYQAIIYGVTLLGLSLFPGFLYLIRRRKVVVLLRTFGISILVQCFALIAFWACFKSLDQTIPIALFVAVSAGIFVTAVVPAAVGGFGAREVGAVVFMAPLGVSAEISFTASVLYGIMASLQGLFFLCCWIKK